MYQITVDKENKLISVKLAGHMELDEVKRYTNQIENTIKDFAGNEVRLLMDLERLDPVSQDAASEFVRNLSEISRYVKKVGSIHRRVVTRMQMERIEISANNTIPMGYTIRRFKTKQEAMAYLDEE